MSLRINDKILHKEEIQVVLEVSKEISHFRNSVVIVYFYEN